MTRVTKYAPKTSQVLRRAHGCKTIRSIPTAWNLEGLSGFQFFSNVECPCLIELERLRHIILFLGEFGLRMPDKIFQYFPLFFNLFHCFLISSIILRIIFHYASNIFHYFSLLSIVFHYFELFSIIVHYVPTIYFVHYFPVFSIVFHYLSILFH